MDNTASDLVDAGRHVSNWDRAFGLPKPQSGSREGLTGSKEFLAGLICCYELPELRLGDAVRYRGLELLALAAYTDDPRRLEPVEQSDGSCEAHPLRPSVV